MTEGNNVDSTILKLAEQYQSTLERSRELNEERSTIRENVGKLGIDPKAFQVGLMMTRDLTKGERDDYSNSLTRVISVLDGKEADLFGAEEVKKRDERAARRAEKAATGTAADDDTDSPRGDPAKGGAGGVDGTKPAKDAEPKAVEPAVTKRKPGRPKKGGDNVVPIGSKKGVDIVSQSGVTAEDVPLVDEQDEGAAILDGALAGAKAKGADDLAALPDVPVDEPRIEEDGDAMIQRVSAQKNAERVAREAGVGMEPIDASGDDGSVDNTGLVSGKHGLGSVADEVPLSQSDIARQKREAAGLN